MKKIWILAMLRIKLIFSEKILLIFCLVCPFLFSLLIGMIFQSTEEIKKIPVVIIDEDHTNTSEKMIKNISANEALLCIDEEKDKAFELLKDNKIQGMYILKEGLQRGISNNNFEEIIDIYYLKDNIVAPGLGEIVAGEGMHFICAAKATNKVKEIFMKKNIVDNGNIERRVFSYIDLLEKKNTFPFPIKILYDIPDTKTDIEAGFTMDEGLFVKRISIGMLLCFNMLFLLFSATTIVKEKTNFVFKRLKLCGYKSTQIILGNGVGIFASGMLIGSIQLLTLYQFIMEIQVISIINIIVIYVSYIFCISTLILLICEVFDNTIALQSFAPFFTFFLGLIGGGFLSVEFFPEKIRFISQLTPIYWGLEAFSKYIFYGVHMSEIKLNIFMLWLIGFTLLGLTMLYQLFFKSIKAR